MIILFVLLWMAFWSCATVAKDTHPWFAAFLKLFVVAQMLGAVAIAILILTGVVHFQPMITSPLVKHFVNNGSAISYSYDENGNISSIQSPDGSYVTYEYDYLNQLTKETYRRWIQS
ncbi:MAG: RHS repeat protein [Clostridia bacterium]|nr:RHS repeat protein [Clostridia bacterium]